MYKVYRGETVEDALQKGLNDLNVEESDISIDVLQQGSKGFLGLMKKEAEVKLTIINPELKQLNTIEAVQMRHLEDSIEETTELEVTEQEVVEEETDVNQVDTVEEVVDMKEDTVEQHEEQLDDSYEETDVQTPKFTFDEAVESTANYIQSVVNEMGISNYTDYTVDDRTVMINVFADKAAKVIGKRGSTLNALSEIGQHYFNRIYKGYGRIIIDTENYREKREEILENLAINMSKKAVRTNLPVHLEPMPAYERKIIHNALYNVTNIKTYSAGKEPNRHIVIERE
ncbi:RNA-binding cell elongation regulator Jag/EloR [Nosocomiicoccus ampullae]|uniref:RNA-binding cell elongation regulator Jag/EloR n=1 Tax=Nosocomiicoccus ampullae TaxID=489910 RepID=UPI00254DD657|nr:RNA-binding cell elongation regulator Jag/EloR [Nosocomiicoccus ampullae]MDK6862839.1 RNA-binding cell elongation regulator Jag/EloR [Nosocomiicoccus ampullae]